MRPQYSKHPQYEKRQWACIISQI